MQAVFAAMAFQNAGKSPKGTTNPSVMNATVSSNTKDNTAGQSIASKLSSKSIHTYSFYSHRARLHV